MNVKFKAYFFGIITVLIVAFWNDPIGGFITDLGSGLAGLPNATWR